MEPKESLSERCIACNMVAIVCGLFVVLGTVVCIMFLLEM